jgi:hypothetical protein
MRPENGGISVRGGDRTDIRVTARILAYADSDARARRLAEDVRIETGARVRATGPDTARDEHWSVSFDVDVPRNARLSLDTRNGGISIEDFRGAATFHATNGGISLTDVGGDIRGETLSTLFGETCDLLADTFICTVEDADDYLELSDSLKEIGRECGCSTRRRVRCARRRTCPRGTSS